MQGELSQKDKIVAFALGILVGLVFLVIALFQIPAINNRISWRLDFAMTFVRGLVDPVKPLPTAGSVAGVIAGEENGLDIPIAETATPSVTPSRTATIPADEPTPTITATPPPTFTPTPIPASIQLAVPEYEKQDLNNCGPATLAMHLRFYNWQGDQFTISELIKPKREDRNVNIEELAYYVNTQVQGLELQYRVGGDIEMLKRLMAAGYPVTVEAGYVMLESYWLNDDRWAGHYLLLTSYDDTTQKFVAQDVFVGANQSISYEELDKHWKAFNRVYVVIYPFEDRPVIQSLLGEHWEVRANRQHALDLSQKETEIDPTDSYAWFNMGTNLVYFERYAQAGQAYDNAREHGLPQRMLRYQFGPFFAYFHAGRMDDLLALLDYALKRTPTSEEAMLWRGWAEYRQGNKAEATQWFTDALEARPGYTDAIYGLNFVRDN
jgi:tetratricopeptide (TPR) repeat protein